MWKKLSTSLLIAIVSAAGAAAQSSTPPAKTYEFIDVPEAPKRIEVITAPTTGPSYYDKLCMDIHDLRPEDHTSCVQRLGNETYDLGNIVGTYDWDWRTQLNIAKGPLTDFDISFTFGADNKVKVNSCFDNQYKYVLDKNRLGYSLAITRDWDYAAKDNCENPATNELINLLLETLSDGCGIPCDFAWRDDDIYLVNFEQKARMRLTRRMD